MAGALHGYPAGRNAQRRHKKLLILCPAFVSDCLETLEEIAIRGKETFIEAGGVEYEMIPCLNADPLWVQTLAGWTKEIREGSQEMILK